MPNWIQNYVEIRGDEDKLGAVLKAVRYNEPRGGDHTFDFHGDSYDVFSVWTEVEYVGGAA